MGMTRRSERKRLFQCETEQEQTHWVCETLKEGGRVHIPMLWLGGVDRPLSVIRMVKVEMKKQGLRLRARREAMRDAGDEVHEEIVWRLEGCSGSEAPA
jgi:hypothetical protein